MTTDEKREEVPDYVRDDCQSSRTEFEAYQPAAEPSLWRQFKSQATTKDGWWGGANFNWAAMCMPTFLVKKEQRHTPFYGLNSRVPILLAAVMGFQHALAMISGRVAVGIDRRTKSQTYTQIFGKKVSSRLY